MNTEFRTLLQRIRNCCTQWLSTLLIVFAIASLLFGNLLLNRTYASPGDSDTFVYLPFVSQENPAGMRPYTDASIWNTPIRENPQYDPHSAEMIQTIGQSDDGEITSDPSQYSFPVYFVDAETPRWDVSCTEYNCLIVQNNKSTTTVPVLQDVPIPSNAQPSEGSDSQMIIIDPDTGTEYDLWRAQRTNSGWSVSNASVYNIYWDGMPPRYGSRGAGVPYFAGLIRPWEIRQGHIEHAIAFAYPYPAKDHCVFPASKTDGDSSLAYAIPEGARLQLDPSLTDADFDVMGLDRTGKIIARALQEYGMFMIDNSGRPKIYAEDLVNNPLTSMQWSDPELNLTSKTIRAISYTHFRVLDLPDAYWTGQTNGPMHGDCYK